MPTIRRRTLIAQSSRSLGVRTRAGTGGIEVGDVEGLTATDDYAAQMHAANLTAVQELPELNQQDQTSRLLAVSSQSLYPGKARYRAVYGVDETVPSTVDPFSVALEDLAGERQVQVPKRYVPGATWTSIGPNIKQRPIQDWTDVNSSIPIEEYAGTNKRDDPLHVIRVPFVLPYWPITTSSTMWNKINSDAVMINGQERAIQTVTFRGLNMRGRPLHFIDGTIKYSGFYVFTWSPTSYQRYIVRISRSIEFGAPGSSGAGPTSVTLIPRGNSNVVSFVNEFPHELGAGPGAP